MTKHMDVVMDGSGAESRSAREFIGRESGHALDPSGGTRGNIPACKPDKQANSSQGAWSRSSARSAILQSTRQFGWNAAYREGAMFLPELVECGVAVGAGGVEMQTRSRTGKGRRPEAVAHSGEPREREELVSTAKPFASRSSARPSPLPNPTDTISDFLNWMNERQANG